MAECVFCKIIAGEIPADKIVESTNFVAFLDASPQTKGHSLIVPKKHATNFLELPEYLGNELVEFSQRVAEAVVQATGAQGFNLLVNTGAVANQTVFHVHMHVIPRSDSDGVQSMRGSYHSSPEEITAVRNQIVRFVRQ